MSIYEKNLCFIPDPNESNQIYTKSRSYSKYRFFFCRFHFRWI